MPPPGAGELRLGSPASYRVAAPAGEPALGRAVQVDPIKPRLKPPETKRFETEL